MKIKINKREFKKHLENISRGMVSYSHLPSLQGLFMNVNESKIVLITSDGFLSIKEIIMNNDGILIKEPGKVLVPARIFKDIIDKMEDTIEIYTSNSIMTISSAGFKTEINLFNVEDYPRISFESFGKELIIDANEFKDMIKNVAFASAIDDKKIILNGVNIKANNNKLTISATNSFRLAQETKIIDSSIDFDIIILSKKIRDFLPVNTKGDVTIKVDETKIISNIGSTTISSRLIDDIYLPIEKLISSKFLTKIILDAKDVEKNIDRVTLVSGGGKKIIKLSVNEKSLIFQSKKSEIGEAKSNIENFEIRGEPIDIIFDYSFLKDAISRYNGKIVMAFNGSQKPFIIKGKSNENLIQLIMPHRTF